MKAVDPNKELKAVVTFRLTTNSLVANPPFADKNY